MNSRDIRQEMTTIAADLLETDSGGVHWSPVMQSFKDAHNGELDELASDLRDDYLRHCATDVVNSLRRTDNAQLELPGFGKIDGTVTTVDGEGGFVVKRIGFATIDDLTKDFELHVANVDAAVKARRRADRRNRALIPVMESHGFDVAGEAIELLSQGDPS